MSVQESLVELQLQLSALDCLEQAFVYLGQDGEARFLSSRGARLLDIRERHDLAKHKELLTPLIALARPLLGSDGQRTASAKLGAPPEVKELNLTALNGRVFEALAFARPLSISGSDIDGAVVLFQDVTLFRPFFHSIEQSRRHRAIIVMVSSFLGRSALVDGRGNDLLTSYKTAERDFFRKAPSVAGETAQTELQTALSTAIDIVDPLLPSSAKIVSDAKTTALLSISEPNFLRIICHLLLEAGDFIGPSGATSIKSAVHSQAKVDDRSPETSNQVVLSFHAERREELRLDANPLELYFYRRYMPVHYKISLAEDTSDESSGQQFQDVHFGANATVAQDSLSENLRIAGHLATACGESLQVKRPKPHLLVLSASFRLHVDLR